jgi:hypothetical protein
MRSTKLLPILTLFISCGQPSKSHFSDAIFSARLDSIRDMMNNDDDDPELIRGCIQSLKSFSAQTPQRQKELDQLDSDLLITE